MTHHPPQQPGPPGPWDPRQQQPQAFEYPAYPGYPVPSPDHPYGYPPAPRQGNGIWWIVGGIVSALVITALVVGGVFLFRNGAQIAGPSDEAEIQQLVQEFSAAGNSGQFADLGRFFCAAEAGMFGALGELGQLLEGIDIPETAPTVEVSATDIQVKGDVASATLATGGPFETAYFRKESGEWKVCMSAMVEFSQK